MTNQERPPSDDFVRRARARIEHMQRTAQELTEELGLPPQATYDLLSTMATTALPAAFLQPVENEALSPQNGHLPTKEVSKNQGSETALPPAHSHKQARGKKSTFKTITTIIFLTIMISGLASFLKLTNDHKTASHAKPDRINLVVVTTVGLSIATACAIYRLDANKGLLTPDVSYTLGGNFSYSIQMQASVGNTGGKTTDQGWTDGRDKSGPYNTTGNRKNISQIEEFSQYRQGRVESDANLSARSVGAPYPADKFSPKTPFLHAA